MKAMRSTRWAGKMRGWRRSRLTALVGAACLAVSLPLSLAAQIAAVTPEQVKSAAGILLGSQDSVIAIVGDYTKVKDQLAGFKEIKFLDPDGKPIPAPQ